MPIIGRRKRKGSGNDDTPSSSKTADSSEKDVLSIEQTNELRKKLGLAPLGEKKTVVSEGKSLGSIDNEIQAKPVNPNHLKKEEEIRNKLLIMKEKRENEEKLAKIKKLAEKEKEEDAMDWVKKSRLKEKQKTILKEQEETVKKFGDEFGVSSMVSKKPQSKGYSSKDLAGLKVDHDASQFKEGREVILTLKDKGILEDDDEGDVLTNVNIIDDEKHKENVQNKKKSKTYNPYENVDDVDDYGELKNTDTLEKYDEVIEGKKKKDYFVLENQGEYEGSHEKMKENFKKEFKMSTQSLILPELNLATDYYTEAEMESFKKKKRKVKNVREKEATSGGKKKKDKMSSSALKADDLIDDKLPELQAKSDLGVRGSNFKKETFKPVSSLEEDHSVSVDKSSAQKRLPDVDEAEEVSSDESLFGESLPFVLVDEDEASLELQAAIARQRKLAAGTVAPKYVMPKEPQHFEEEDEEDEKRSDDEQEATSSGKNDKVVSLSSTSEFCRNLNVVSTGGRTQLDEDDDEYEKGITDMEVVNPDNLLEMGYSIEPIEKPLPTWSSAMDHDNPQSDSDEDCVETDEFGRRIRRPAKKDATEASQGLGDEPSSLRSVADAVKMAARKGYIDSGPKKMDTGVGKVAQHASRDFTICESKAGEDERGARGNRYRNANGPLVEFKELRDYDPKFEIKYVDETGKAMNEKEAFKDLSYRFHGRMPGKKKIEKRQLKAENEARLLKLQSLDQPTKIVNKIIDKQRKSKTAFIPLSGKSNADLQIKK